MRKSLFVLQISVAFGLLLTVLSLAIASSGTPAHAAPGTHTSSQPFMKTPRPLPPATRPPVTRPPATRPPVAVYNAKLSITASLAVPPQIIAGKATDITFSVSNRGLSTSGSVTATITATNGLEPAGNTSPVNGWVLIISKNHITALHRPLAVGEVSKFTLKLKAIGSVVGVASIKATITSTHATEFTTATNSALATVKIVSATLPTPAHPTKKH